MVEYVRKRPEVTVSDERKKQIAEENSTYNKEFSQKNARGALRSMGYNTPEPKTQAPAEAPKEPSPIFPRGKGKLESNLEHGTKEAMIRPVANNNPIEPETPVNEETPVFQEPLIEEQTPGVGSIEFDPYEDQELYPITMWNTPAQDYWSTAEPANEEEKRTFHSQPFQQATLTMGLSLLLGNSLEDSMYTGMQAYAQSDYINTNEYAELANAGVPEEVIRGAFNSGDWTQVKSWQKDIDDKARMERQYEMEQQKMIMQGNQFNAGQQLKVQTMNNQIQQFNIKMATQSKEFGIKYMQEQEKALRAAANLAPNEYQKKIHSSNLANFEKIRTEVQQTNKQMQYAQSIQAKFAEGKTVDKNELVALLNSGQSIFDPKGTVKEGDVALMMSGLGLPARFASEMEKFLTTGVVDANSQFARSLANAAVSKGTESLNSLYSNISGLSRSSTVAGIPEQYQPWRFDTTLRSSEKLDNLYSKYMGG